MWQMAWFALLALSACQNDPIRYIPPEDRTLLQTQARLDASPGEGKGITVQEMLQRAKTNAAGPVPSSRVLVRFLGGAVEPDAAGQEQLRAFAAQLPAPGLPVVVSSRPGDFTDPAAPVLGQRRAVAVSRLLAGRVGNVQLRFDAALPPDVVVVRAGLPGEVAAP